MHEAILEGENQIRDDGGGGGTRKDSSFALVSRPPRLFLRRSLPPSSVFYDVINACFHGDAFSSNALKFELCHVVIVIAVCRLLQRNVMFARRAFASLPCCPVDCLLPRSSRRRCSLRRSLGMQRRYSGALTPLFLACEVLDFGARSWA